jgi:hypothetical protein
MSLPLKDASGKERNERYLSGLPVGSDRGESRCAPTLGRCVPCRRVRRGCCAHTHPPAHRPPAARPGSPPKGRPDPRDAGTAQNHDAMPAAAASSVASTRCRRALESPSCTTHARADEASRASRVPRAHRAHHGLMLEADPVFFRTQDRQNRGTSSAPVPDRLVELIEIVAVVVEVG